MFIALLLPYDSAPKKGKSTFPSGMVARWKPKGPGTNHDLAKTTGTLPSEERKLGGLNDDDADTVQPSFGGPKNCMNNICYYHSYSSSYAS
jgi:hypothetical protein